MSKTLAPPILLFVIAAAILFTANRCMAQSYTLTDLGASGIYTVRAINNNGQLVGQSAPSGDSTSSNLSDPFLLSNGTLTDLGNFGNPQGAGAYAVNSLGEVVGLAGTAGGGQKPFLFSNGSLTELSADGGTPLGINTAGTIVGYFAPEPSSPIDLVHAFAINNGVFTDLGQGEMFSEAMGINTSGQIAGDSENPNISSLAREAAIFQPDGTLTFLGALGGFESRAFAINDVGQVTGNSYTGDGNLHAFLFSNGQMTDIDTFHSQASWAFGINSNAVVVGMFTPSSTSMAYDAFVYMFGSMMDLNSLIPAGSGLTLIRANGINDVGEIVGQAQSNSDGTVHGFLLKPVAPQITSISPTAGPAGTLVTINGNHFTTKPKACKVTINGKVATWTTWSNTKIQVKVPNGVNSGKVVVTAFFQPSRGVSFTVN